MYGPEIRFEYSRGEKSGGRVGVKMGPPLDEAKAAKLFTSWINDNRMRLYLATSPCTESAELEWVKGQNGKLDDLTWTIVLDNKIAGSIGLHQIDRIHQRAELGIMIGKDYWGNGLAQAVEAVVLDYAFSNIVAGGLHKVDAGVLSGNEASKSALRKVGLRDVAVRKDHFWFNGKWFDLWEGEILASEWSVGRVSVMKVVGMKHLDLYCGCESEGFAPEEFG